MAGAEIRKTSRPGLPHPRSPIRGDDGSLLLLGLPDCSAAMAVTVTVHVASFFVRCLSWVPTCEVTLTPNRLPRRRCALRESWMSDPLIWGR